MSNYKHSSKRECDMTEPMARLSCHFPVGNAKLIELYARNTEFTVWFEIELPGLRRKGQPPNRGLKTPWEKRYKLVDDCSRRSPP